MSGRLSAFNRQAVGQSTVSCSSLLHVAIKRESCVMPLPKKRETCGQRLLFPKTSHVTRAAMLEAAPEASFASLMDDEDEEASEYDEDQEVIRVDANQEVDESLKVVNLGLSSETVRALERRGITSLFAIQKAVFQPAQEGRDLIGRARTGSGKTLAFALPVVESLIAEDLLKKQSRGRTPRCIVLAPTRELANQVAKEFYSVCPSLKVASFYGGTSIMTQIRDLAAGVDVVVGTPGRVIDLINRGKLVLDQVRFAILDEADQMLDMGFEEDMETILGQIPKERQTMLFSATLPAWVNKIARRYQNNPMVVDLVGAKDTGRLAESITLRLMLVEGAQKMSAMMDVINLYSVGGKSIVFVNTKMMCDQVAERVNETMPCVVLHGDISQAQRDRGLQQFRDGKYQVLVATDVAARGLDIPSVELVVHYDVPQDAEAFLHRSGRTGRANKTGNAVILFKESESRAAGQILQQTKVTKAQFIGSPAPADVMNTASRNVLSQLDKVDNEVIDFFVPAAERLMASENPSKVLAAALASMSGFRKPPRPRSLLTYDEGIVTLRLLEKSSGGSGGPVDGRISLAKLLKAVCKKAKISMDVEPLIGKVKLLEDQDGLNGAAFDLPLHEAQALLKASETVTSMGYSIEQATSITVDVSEMLVGGRRGPPRSDRGSRGWGRGGSSSGPSYGGKEERRGYGGNSGSSPSYGKGYGSDRGSGSRSAGSAPLRSDAYGSGSGRRDDWSKPSSGSMASRGERADDYFEPASSPARRMSGSSGKIAPSGASKKSMVDDWGRW